MTDHHQLLAEYTRTGSDAAFRELVTRYVDLVYSTAVRLVGGDAHLAQDVAQTVFLDLSNKAKTLPTNVMLGGWLHRDTCFVAAKLMRAERRRQSRERQAVEMNALQNDPGADFTLIAPLLDDAINELAEDDRTAVLLRFYEQRDFRSVGAALGSNEDAARMRVNRAMEKLQGLLKRRGVTTTAATLSVVLTANAVQAAPVGLALTISSAATLSVAGATAVVTKTITMTLIQKTAIASLAILAGVGIYQARQVSQLKERVQTLQQQQAPLTEQLQQAQQERDLATQQLAAIQNDNERLNRNTTELMKLRAQKASSGVRDLASAPAASASTPLLTQALPPMDTNQFAPFTSDQPADVLAYPQIMRDSAGTNYARATNRLADAKTPHDRYLALSQAAKLAFTFGDYDDARKYATEVLTLDQSERAATMDGDAMFSGNMVLGRLALREGRLDEAKNYLLEAGRTPGSPNLNSFGPNMTLARDLLRSGEQQTVLQYFELCQKFWSSGGDNLRRWTRDVRAGNMPDFDANIYY